MPNSSARPFGHDTLKLRALFVPERAKSQPSSAVITGAVGHGAVKIPAVFVPQGGKSPGGSYVHVGKAEFRPDQDRGTDSAATRTFTRHASSRPTQPDTAEREQRPPLPRTRYRFGTEQGGDHAPGPPPNPSRADFAADPMRAAVRVWRSMRNAGRPKAGAQAGPDEPTSPQEGAQASTQKNAQAGAQPDASAASDPHGAQSDPALPLDTP